MSHYDVIPRIHLKQAAKTLKFYELNIPNFKIHFEWRVILIFYFLVRLIDAYLVDRGENVTSHSKRLKLVKHYMPKAKKAFNKLKKLSETARYEDPSKLPELLRYKTGVDIIINTLKSSINNELVEFNPKLFDSEEICSLFFNLTPSS